MRSADIQAGPRQGKRLFRKIFGAVRLCIFAWGWWGGVGTLSAQVGATFDTLEANGVLYRAVKVLSVSPAAVTFRHEAGISQVPLAALPEELQARFGYDPEYAALEDSLNEKARERNGRKHLESLARRRAEANSVRDNRRPGTDTPVGRALARFGTPAEKRPVDLRPRFRELELGTKRQGLRPSCAVFAVVSALEYQSAADGGRADRLSEEYLIWATRRTLGIPAGEKRSVDSGDAGDTDNEESRDAGFTLMEVLAALRAYGIPLQSEMPNTFGIGMEKIPEPSADVIQGARARRQVATFTVPGVSNDVKVENIMHALNEGVPVVVGLRWPHWRTLRAPLLSQQTPHERYSHAVTLVGYYSESGRPEDIRFIFKNSWGIRWGNGGYGVADIAYLRKNLLDAVVIEVRPGTS